MARDFIRMEDFTTARKKARMQKLLSTLQWKHSDLLSLYEVTKLVKPRNETYRGVVAIPVSKIIGSEGRYHDFTSAFFPKKDLLRQRWLSINQAHHQDIILPAISVYKLGDSYFVRDGNHRVSVAKAEGVEFIDAEVVELDSQIELEPGMTQRQIRKKVVDYERQRFLEQYHLDSFMDMNLVDFSSPGMYPEVVNHILVHKYYINEQFIEEIPFEAAAKSWYDNVFLPIVKEIRRDRLLVSFPGKTEGDLYMWIVRHWDNLKSRTGEDISIETASEDYKRKFGKGWFRRWLSWIREVFSRK